MKRMVLAAAILLTAVAAGAAPPAVESLEQTDSTSSGERVSAAAADPDTTAEDERKICRSDKVTGSLSRRNRICLTAAQWREVHDRTRRGVDEMNSAASGGKVCHPDPADPFQGCPG
jgi:hypothetical protein